MTTRPLLLTLPLCLALCACGEKEKAKADPAKEMLEGLHAAAINEGYRRVLSQAPGATDLAKQDLKDATTRLSRLEKRALDAGLSGPDIDPTIASGEKQGEEDAQKTLQERAERKASGG